MWSPPLSIQQGYLYLVLSSSNPLIVVAWFVWQQGKFGLGQIRIHTNQGTFRTLTLRDEANIISFPIFHWLRTLVDGPRQLSQVLFRTNRACYYCINQVTVFQGQSSILGNMPSHPGAVVAALSIHQICSYWRVSCEGSYPSQRHQLPDCQQVPVPYELGHGR